MDSKIMPTDEILKEMLVSLLVEKRGWLLGEAREYTRDMTEFSPAYREKILEWSSTTNLPKFWGGLDFLDHSE